MPTAIPILFPRSRWEYLVCDDNLRVPFNVLMGLTVLFLLLSVAIPVKWLSLTACGLSGFAFGSMVAWLGLVFRRYDEDRVDIDCGYPPEHYSRALMVAAFNLNKSSRKR